MELQAETGLRSEPLLGSASFWHLLTPRCLWDSRIPTFWSVHLDKPMPFASILICNGCAAVILSDDQQYLPLAVAPL